MTIKEAYEKKFVVHGETCYAGNIFPEIKILQRWKSGDVWLFNDKKESDILKIEMINEYFPFVSIDTWHYDGLHIIAKFEPSLVESVIDEIGNKFKSLTDLIIEGKPLVQGKMQNYGHYHSIKMKINENILVRFDNDLEFPVLYLPEHEYYSIE